MLGEKGPIPAEILSFFLFFEGGRGRLKLFLFGSCLPKKKEKLAQNHFLTKINGENIQSLSEKNLADGKIQPSPPRGWGNFLGIWPMRKWGGIFSEWG